MRFLGISNMCLVLGLMVGLTMAWNDATPQLITGEHMAKGGCDKCEGEHNYYCKDLPNNECNDYCIKCDLDSTADEICRHKATHCSCADITDGCENVPWHESCD